jgi:hypothetical protein
MTQPRPVSPPLTLPLPPLRGTPQDASKARESRLRKAGLQGRARMAAELRDMDNDIAALSKALAVRCGACPAARCACWGGHGLQQSLTGRGMAARAGVVQRSRTDCPPTTPPVSNPMPLPVPRSPSRRTAGAHAAAGDGVCVRGAGG